MKRLTKLFLTLIIGVAGIIALNSAAGGAGGNIDEYNKQIIWFFVVGFQNRLNGFHGFLQTVL